MAQTIARGVESVNSAEAIIRSVHEVSTTCESTASAVPDQGAPYAEASDLTRCDGLIMGSPTRFGNMSAPLKYFIDQSSSQ